MSYLRDTALGTMRLLLALAWLLVASGATAGHWWLQRTPDPDPVTEDTLGTSASSDELKAGAGSQLHFSSLSAWAFDPALAPTQQIEAPPALAALSGHEVQVMGFMYPLQQGAAIEHFMLMQSTQTCCYGPAPEYNRYVLVTMDGTAVPYDPQQPVIIHGRFHIDPQPDDGYIYRLEGARFETVLQDDSNEGERDPSQTEVPLIDLAILTGLKEGASIPPAIAALHDTEASVRGFNMLSASQKRRVVIGRDWFDGCCQGTPPSIDNSVVVRLGRGQAPPQPWEGRCAYTGKISVPGIASGTLTGPITLNAAVRGWTSDPNQTPQAKRRRLLLWTDIAVALLGFAWLAVPELRVNHLRRCVVRGHQYAQERALAGLMRRCRTGMRERRVLQLLAGLGERLVDDEQGTVLALRFRQEAQFLFSDTPHDLARHGLKQFFGTGVCGLVCQFNNGRLIRKDHWGLSLSPSLQGPATSDY
ncbi:MAG: DUF3299 domain-containing protein [Planctomycetota bacterium]|jgi:hypothetical protein|nr:DUF3299 domain-containing protein [Planctomycetota bacterium]